MARMTQKEMEEYGKKTITISRHDMVDAMIDQLHREREMMIDSGLDLPAQLMLEGMYKNFCIAIVAELYKDKPANIFKEETEV